MKSKSTPRPPRTSTSRKPSPSSTRRRPGASGPAASRSASSTDTGAGTTSDRKSWRARTGSSTRPKGGFRERAKAREAAAAARRPRRIAGVLSRPAVGDPELTQDFDRLMSMLQGVGLKLEETERAGLWAYGKFLVERAGTLNLISQIDRPRFFTRHMFECLIPGLVSHARRSHELVDIGSGGGLPGLPLAIVCPDLRVVLVEPRQRKVQFLEAAILECGLSLRVQVFQGTAERFADQLLDGPTADFATARAVDRLEKVWGWTQRLLTPGGWLATYKGPGEIEAELQRLSDHAPSGIEAFPCPGQPRAVLLIQRAHK